MVPWTFDPTTLAQKITSTTKQTDSTEANLLNKCSCLVTDFGVTKFIPINVMSLGPLSQHLIFFLTDEYAK